MRVSVQETYHVFTLTKNLADASFLLMVDVVETVTILRLWTDVLQIVVDHLMKQGFGLGFYKAGVLNLENPSAVWQSIGELVRLHFVVFILIYDQELASCSYLEDVKAMRITLDPWTNALTAVLD